MRGFWTSVFKEEPEDLTHLAPTAGDSCIPLDVPNVIFPADFLQLDLVDLTPDVLDCFPLTGFEFPSPVLPMELGNDLSAAPVSSAASPPANNVAEESDGTTSRATSSLLSTSSAFKDDPFLFFGPQNVTCSSGSESVSDSASPPSTKVSLSQNKSVIKLFTFDISGNHRTALKRTSAL